LLIISSQENKAIPYHDKVINTITSKMMHLDPQLLNFNWYISGSFAVNSLYAPSKHSNDVDFYFSNENDYLECLNYLKSKYLDFYYSTEFADTFTNLNIQLVKKWFLPPEELIYTHDFVNVSVAISKEKIYTTKETHFSWYNETLKLRNFQISKNPPATHYEKVVALIQLTERSNKYLDRYELDISPSFKSFLYAQKAFLETLDPSAFTAEQPVILTYYGSPVDHSTQITSAISSLKSLLQIESSEFVWPERVF
jgi:hypothetical protein